MRQNKNTGSRRLVPIARAAEHGNVSTRTVRRYVAQGLLTGYRSGPRLIMIDLDEYDEIVDAVRDARKVVDRPAEKLYAGPCDCGEDLYASLHNVYVTCASTAHEEPVVWPVEDRRRWLLHSAEDVLATTTEISRALTRYAQPVTPSAIRGHVGRGQLVRKGGSDGKPLYRLGDVLDILARQAERASA